MTQEEANNQLEELLSSERVENSMYLHEGDYSNFRKVSDEIALLVRKYPSYIKYIKSHQQQNKNKALQLKITEQERLYYIGRESAYAQILADMLRAEKNVQKKEKDLQK